MVREGIKVGTLEGGCARCFFDGCATPGSARPARPACTPWNLGGGGVGKPQPHLDRHPTLPFPSRQISFPFPSQLMPSPAPAFLAKLGRTLLSTYGVQCALHYSMFSTANILRSSSCQCSDGASEAVWVICDLAHFRAAFCVSKLYSATTLCPYYLDQNTLSATPMPKEEGIQTHHTGCSHGAAQHNYILCSLSLVSWTLEGESTTPTRRMQASRQRNIQWSAPFFSLLILHHDITSTFVPNPRWQPCQGSCCAITWSISSTTATRPPDWSLP